MRAWLFLEQIRPLFIICWRQAVILTFFMPQQDKSSKLNYDVRTEQPEKVLSPIEDAKKTL